MTTNKKMVTAAFRRRFDAEAAHEWLRDRGYTSKDINVLMSDATRKTLREDADENIAVGSMAAEGVATGGAIGTAIGATLAAIAAIGTTIALPGLGIVLAGPIVAALAGGGAGAVAGGIVGGLVGFGIPESNAKAYEAVLRDGGIVIGVASKSSEDASAIMDHFKELHAENVVST